MKADRLEALLHRAEMKMDIHSGYFKKGDVLKILRREQAYQRARVQGDPMTNHIPVPQPPLTPEQIAVGKEVEIRRLMARVRELEQVVQNMETPLEQIVTEYELSINDVVREREALKASLAALTQAHQQAVWPNIMAPACYENPAVGWEDSKLPDFQLIWRLAREVGYAVCIHGSLKRDVDLIAAPWTDEAVGNKALIDHLCTGLNATMTSGPERKPYGRYAATLQIDGYYKPIDLSIMPRNTDLLAELQQAVEALRALHDVQNGAPLFKYEMAWNDAMNLAQAVFATHKEKG